jgi:hypothetical protein
VKSRSSAPGGIFEGDGDRNLFDRTTVMVHTMNIATADAFRTLDPRALPT